MRNTKACKHKWIYVDDEDLGSGWQCKICKKWQNNSRHRPGCRHNYRMTDPADPSYGMVCMFCGQYKDIGQ